jgi:hypothetical protein
LAWAVDRRLRSELLRAFNEINEFRFQRQLENRKTTAFRGMAASHGFEPWQSDPIPTVALPDSLPFIGIKFEGRQSTFYRSSLDVEKLVESAREELALAEPKAFKIFLLAVMVDLRRREIDLLELSAFRW